MREMKIGKAAYASDYGRTRLLIEAAIKRRHDGFDNPAIAEERRLLERKALIALKKWASDPILGMFTEYSELIRATQELLAFEKRHSDTKRK